MFLFHDVMDKQLEDCNGRKAGRVDDLLLELRPGRQPVVRAIVTGHGSLAALLPRLLARPLLTVERIILGVEKIEPRIVGWEHVTRIDVTVHLDLDREKAGLTSTERTIWRRWISALPWASR